MRRLQTASSEKKFCDAMQIEDEIIDVLKEKQRYIENRERELEKALVREDEERRKREDAS